MCSNVFILDCLQHCHELEIVWRSVTFIEDYDDDDDDVVLRRNLYLLTQCS